jgi:hypothetical protein
LRGSNAKQKEDIGLLREDMRANHAALREDIGLLREEQRLSVTRLQTEIQTSERRSAERLERIYDAVKISD